MPVTLSPTPPQNDTSPLFEVAERAKTNKDGNIETDENGRTLTVCEERPRLISELSPDIAKLIEEVTYDSKGRAVPKLYSKLQASKELRAMLNIGGQKDTAADLSRLSDAELIQRLSDQAKELGIEIDLNYRIAQQPTAKQTDGNGGGGEYGKCDRRPGARAPAPDRNTFAPAPTP